MTNLCTSLGRVGVLFVGDFHRRCHIVRRVLSLLIWQVGAGLCESKIEVHIYGRISCNFRNLCAGMLAHKHNYRRGHEKTSRCPLVFQLGPVIAASHDERID